MWLSALDGTAKSKQNHKINSALIANQNEIKIIVIFIAK